MCAIRFCTEKILSCLILTNNQGGMLVFVFVTYMIHLYRVFNKNCVFCHNPLQPVPRPVITSTKVYSLSSSIGCSLSNDQWQPSYAEGRFGGCKILNSREKHNFFGATRLELLLKLLKSLRYINEISNYNNIAKRTWWLYGPLHLHCVRAGPACDVQVKPLFDLSSRKLSLKQMMGKVIRRTWAAPLNPPFVDAPPPL